MKYIKAVNIVDSNIITAVVGIIVDNITVSEVVGNSVIPVVDGINAVLGKITAEGTLDSMLDILVNNVVMIITSLDGMVAAVGKSS